MPSYASLFLAIISFAGHTWAGAWLQSKDNSLIINSTTYYQSDAFFNEHGDKQKQPTFYKAEQNLYAEYGLSDQWTVGANLFMHYLAQESRTTFPLSSGGSITIKGQDENIGLGDPEVFARTLLWKDDFNVLSLQPLVKLPSWYRNDTLPKGGSDDYDIELSLLGGHSFMAYDRYHFTEARLGYRHRLDAQLEDQIDMDVKLGWQCTNQLQWINGIYTTLSTNMPDNPTFTQSGQNDYHLVKIESNLVYQIQPDWFVQMGLSSHIWGRNTGHGYGVTFGTGFSFP